MHAAQATQREMGPVRYVKDRWARSKLGAVEVEAIPPHDLNGRECVVRVLETHDGDSIKVALHVPGQGVVKVMTRLKGVDTPEVSTKNLDEKRLGILARNFVASWAAPDMFTVNGEQSEKDIKLALARTPVMVYARFENNDKYGRPLATLVKRRGDVRSLNDLLIEQGYADEYYGGKKARTFSCT